MRHLRSKPFKDDEITLMEALKKILPILDEEIIKEKFTFKVNGKNVLDPSTRIGMNDAVTAIPLFDADLRSYSLSLQRSPHDDKNNIVDGQVLDYTSRSKGDHIIYGSGDRYGFKITEPNYLPTEFERDSNGKLKHVKCPQCSKIIPVDSNFCSSCGYDFYIGNAIDELTEAFNEWNENENQNKKI